MVNQFNKPSIRLFIVDDFLLNVDMYIRMFLVEHIHVVGYGSNGQDAIDQITHLLPHVILMDCKMPIMDGVTATKMIKIRFPKIKIILTSAYADYKDDALQAGASAFMHKGGTWLEIVDSIIKAAHSD